MRNAAEILEMGDLLKRKPKQLSGGQRQRVALGRAIVREPVAFLMDEPLSNLDAALRVQTRAEIMRLQDRLGTTTVYVTHDQVEAMTMGDRIAVMRAGVLQQVGPPEELYTRPVNVFVARFIGSPAMNLVPAALVGGPGTSGQLLGFRPEHVELGRGGRRRRELRGGRSRWSSTSATSSSCTCVSATSRCWRSSTWTSGSASATTPPSGWPRRSCTVSTRDRAGASRADLKPGGAVRRRGPRGAPKTNTWRAVSP